MTYSVKEMIAEIHKDMHDAREVRNEILEQAKKTNGRVTALEGNPFIKAGVWMVANPWRTLLFAIIFGIIINAWFVSDFRQPLLAFLVGLV